MCVIESERGHEVFEEDVLHLVALLALEPHHDRLLHRPSSPRIRSVRLYGMEGGLSSSCQVGKLCNVHTSHSRLSMFLNTVHTSGAPDHSLGFEDEDLGSSPGW